MKPLSSAAAWLLALVIVAGCASTEVTERQRYEGAKLARPDRIIVHDFTATPPMFRPNRRSPRKWPAPPPTPQQLELGRKLGDQIAKELVADLRPWGCRRRRLPASRRRGPTTSCSGAISSPSMRAAPPNACWSGSARGAAEMRAAVEGYQMTAQVYARLAAARSGPGAASRRAWSCRWRFVAATANPIGLIVGGAVKAVRRGDRLRHYRRRRQADCGRDRGATRTAAEEQGWI